MKKKVVRGGSQGSELSEMGESLERVNLPCLQRKTNNDCYLLKAGMKYSRYSWTTWIVFKIFAKLTKYSVLKSKGREAEANTWISDWGPLVNPFIDYFFFPVLKMIYNFMKPYPDDLYRTFLFPLYHCHLKHRLGPVLFFLKGIFVKFLHFNSSVSKTFICDFGTLSFICIYCYAFGDILWFYWKNRVKEKNEAKTSGVQLVCGHEECSWRHLKRFDIYKLCSLLIKYFLSGISS